MSTSRCRICNEETNEDDVQELSCHHTFCNLCMTVYQGILCPVRFCEGTRSTDVIVDEMEGQNGSQISFGSATSTLFKIDMREKLRCEARKKGHACENIARMVLTHCRHRLCYDCLLMRVMFALENKLPPRCAVSRCANTLSLSEIQSMACHTTQFQRIHELAQKQSIPLILPCEKRPNESELLIECYLYTNENNMKTIVLPKLIAVVDAVTAIVQLLRVCSSKSLSLMDVYVRKVCTEKRGKYKYEKVSTDDRLTVKEAGWAEKQEGGGDISKVTVVIDSDRQIARLR